MLDKDLIEFITRVGLQHNVRISLGTDYEFMIYDREGKRSYPGESPDSPTSNRFMHLNNFFKDNALAEIATTTRSCIEGLLREIKIYHNEIKNQGKFSIKYSPVYEIPDMTKEERVLGCNPDIKMYGDESDNPGAFRMNWRPAGAHIHFGLLTSSPSMNELMKKINTYSNISEILDTLNKNTPLYNTIMNLTSPTNFIANLDATIGLLSVLATDEVEKQKLRRTMYGQAGSYRIKEYGVEYRVLDILSLVDGCLFSFILRLGRHMLRKYTEMIFPIEEQLEIRDIINNSDREKALEKIISSETILKNIMECLNRDAGFDETRKFIEEFYKNPIKDTNYLHRNINSALIVNHFGNFLVNQRKKDAAKG